MHSWKVGNVGRLLCQIWILLSNHDPFVRLPDGEERLIKERIFPLLPSLDGYVARRDLRFVCSCMATETKIQQPINSFLLPKLVNSEGSTANKDKWYVGKIHLLSTAWWMICCCSGYEKPMTKPKESYLRTLTTATSALPVCYEKGLCVPRTAAKLQSP